MLDSWFVVFRETNRVVCSHCIAEALGLAIVIITVLIGILNHDSPFTIGQGILHNRPRTAIPMIHIGSCARLVKDSNTYSAVRWMILIPVFPALVGNRQRNVVKLFVIVESSVFWLIEALSYPYLIFLIACFYLMISARLVAFLCFLNIFWFKVKFWQSVYDPLLFGDELPKRFLLLSHEFWIVQWYQLSTFFHAVTNRFACFDVHYECLLQELYIDCRERFLIDFNWCLQEAFVWPLVIVANDFISELLHLIVDQICFLNDLITVCLSVLLLILFNLSILLRQNSCHFTLLLIIERFDIVH